MAIHNAYPTTDACLLSSVSAEPPAAVGLPVSRLQIFFAEPIESLRSIARFRCRLADTAIPHSGRAPQTRGRSRITHNRVIANVKGAQA